MYYYAAKYMNFVLILIPWCAGDFLMIAAIIAYSGNKFHHSKIIYLIYD